MQLPRVELFKQGDRPLDMEENPGSQKRKDWKDKRDRGCIPDTFTQDKNNMSAGPLIPPTNEPRLLPPLKKEVKLFKDTF